MTMTMTMTSSSSRRRTTGTTTVCERAIPQATETVAIAAIVGGNRRGRCRRRTVPSGRRAIRGEWFQGREWVVFTESPRALRCRRWRTLIERVVVFRIVRMVRRLIG